MSILLLVALVALSLALLPRRRKPAWLLVTIALVAMGKFYGHELVLGQVNLLFGGRSSSSRCWRSGAGRETAAGLLVALAVVVKPYAVIFLPWLLREAAPPRRRGAGAAAAGRLCWLCRRSSTAFEATSSSTATGGAR